MTFVSLPVIVGTLIVGLFVWLIVRQRAQASAERAALERFGFRPCPDKQSWLDETVARLESNSRYTFSVHDPLQLDHNPAVYYYSKTRTRQLHTSEDNPLKVEEILFPLKRRSTDGVMLIVKPSALKPGLATDLIGLMASGPWDAQPEDLEKIEIPIELADSNVVQAFGPRAGSLTELVDVKSLDALKDVGDSGATFVQCRDGWCAVSGMSKKGFQVEDIVNRIKPLLRL